MTDTMRMSYDERRAHYDRVQGLKLEARVEAVNEANRAANFLRPELAGVLATFVGCKVLKVDGSLTKAVEAALPKMPNESRLHIRRTYGELSWVVSVSVFVSEYQGCMSHEAYVHVGTVGRNTNVLESVNAEPLNLRTDYTAAEIRGKRAEYERLKRLADDALSGLSPFNEYDR